ncbi:hypothetical protein D3C87_2068720 [compost metagenome]
MGRGGIAHITAIAAARQPEARRIEHLVAGEAVEERAHVLDAVLALERPIVEADEIFAIAGRSTNIGIEDRDAHLVEQIIVAALKPRT